MKIKIKKESIIAKYYSLILTVGFLCFFNVGFSSTLDAYTQSKKFTFEYTNTSINTIFQKIENQSEYVFLYSKKTIDVLEKKTIRVEDLAISEVLDKLFVNMSIDYDINNRQVTLKESTKPVQTPSSQEVKKKIVTGVIIDEAGITLVGANVVEKGTTNGVITDIDGKFSINVDENAILQISYIGFTSQDISVTNKTNFSITLKEDAQMLEETVVVGYGVMRKSDVSASITSISADDLREKPIVKVTDALQGKIPGVSIAGQSGAPGSSPVIRIRGANSVNSSNDPLIVIDGFMGGDLNTVNPNDIASMEVLKDASATAIYGSRGANGVIIITTKTGKVDKTEVEFNAFMGFQSVTKHLKLLSPLEYAENVNRRRSVGQTHDANATVYDSKWWYYSQESLDKLANGEMHVDWQDEIYKVALMQNYQVSLRTGTEKSQYYVSAQYVDQEGIIMNSDYNKFSGRLKGDFKVTNKLDFGANVFFSRETDHPTSEYTAEAAVNALPTGWVYKEDGSYFNNRESYGGWGESSPNTAGGLWNPVAQALEPVRDIFTTTGTALTYLEYDIIEGLSLRVTASGKLYDRNDNAYYNEHTRQGWGTGGTAEIINAREYEWQNSNILTYRTTLGEDHSLNVTGLFEQQYAQRTSNKIKGRGFINDIKLYHDMSSAEVITERTSEFKESSILSYMGRVNYSYKSKYIFTGAIRADGASKFGEDNKWGYFPSASVAWRVNQEGFLQGAENISDLKLRASWGVTGNQGIDEYETMSRLDMGGGLNYPLNGSDLALGTSHSSAMSNADLKWEKTSQFDLGLDLSLFNNRLSFVFDYYYKKTTDLLFDVPLPEYTGYNTVRANVGSVENKGVEFLVSAVPLVGEFKWNTSFNISANRNKVLELSSGTDGRLHAGGNVSYVIEGEALGSFYGYDFLGVFHYGEEAEAAKYGQAIGSAKIRDVNNNGKFDVGDGGDKTIIGDPNPDFVFGFSNKFSYKGFDLNIFIQGSVGNDIYNAGAEERFGYETTGGEGYRDRYRWHPTHNPNGFYDRYDYTSDLTSAFTLTEYIYSNIFVEDGTYVRLKNVTLAYNLPESFLKKVKLNGVRLYVSGDNLLTIDNNYWGYDPEIGPPASSSDLGSDKSMGVDNSVYPNTKTIMFGVDIRF